MSDIEKILTLLGDIRNDICDLKTGQEVIKLEQAGMKEELKTMKAGTNQKIDLLSEQFVGVVGDFEIFGTKMLESFKEWSQQADSKMIDNVTAIQGPRINAIENQVQGILNSGSKAAGY